MTSSKYKILIWAVVLLMAANVALLCFIWLNNNRPRPARGTPADYLVNELALNDEQQKKLRTLAEQHHQQSLKIREEIKTSRESFFQLLSNSSNADSSHSIDSARSIFLSSTVNGLTRLEELTFDHFKQVRAICTPAQQKKFDEIIQDVLRMIATVGPGGRGPGNGDHRPPPEDGMPPPEH